MTKALVDYDLKQLEVLFKSSKGNTAVLAAIEEELYSRNGPEAAALLDLVIEDAMKSFRDVGPGLGETVRKSLLGTVTAVPPPVTKPLAQVQLVSPARPSAVSAQPQEKAPAPAPSMALHEAERVLGLRNDAPWAQVEAARVSKVALSNPGATAHLPGPEVARRYADAKNANTAYAVLLKARGLAFS